MKILKVYASSIRGLQPHQVSLKLERLAIQAINRGLTRHERRLKEFSDQGLLRVEDVRMPVKVKGKHVTKRLYRAVRVNPSIVNSRERRMLLEGKAFDAVLARTRRGKL